ncbi:MAG: transcription antitermination factor NusB [Spirochaetales bacterium]|nr:transcription antitermination factor NusB [Spirochaetales bacterium]
MISRRKGRVIAFQALYEWDYTHLALSELLKFPWNPKVHEVTEEDLLFSRLLVAGTLEEIESVDRYISKQSKNWQISRLNKVDLAILRMSVYSLIFQKDIPARVTIDEAIEIAREYGTDESFRFVNGVLDGIRKSVEVQ